jgi:hypothetical protein
MKISMFISVKIYLLLNKTLNYFFEYQFIVLLKEKHILVSTEIYNENHF